MEVVVSICRKRKEECEYRSLSTTCRTAAITRCVDCDKKLCKAHAFVTNVGYVCRVHYHQRLK